MAEPTKSPAAPAAEAAPTSTPSPSASAIAPPPSDEANYDAASDDSAALAVLMGAHRDSDGPNAPPIGDPPAPDQDPATVQAQADAAPAAPAAPAVPSDPFGQLKAFQDPQPIGGQPDLPEQDARILRLLQQVQQQERELVARRSVEGLSPDEVAEAKRLLQAKRAAKTDPEVWFREAGWDQQTIQNYIATGGQTPLDPIKKEFEGKVGQLEQRLAQMQQLLEQQKAEQAVNQFKGVIPQHISANAELYPHLTAYYENPIDQMESVWGVIHHARTRENKNLSVAEAASSLEKVLAQEAKKFEKALSKRTGKPATESPKVTKQPTQTLTNQVGSSSGSSAPADEDWAALDSHALSALRASIRANAS